MDTNEESIIWYKAGSDTSVSTSAVFSSGNEAFSEDETVSEEEDIMLFDGSAVTQEIFNHLLFLFADKHKLSEAAKDDLLKLFTAVAPEKNTIPASKYKHNKALKHFQFLQILKELCPKCKTELDIGNKCINHNCNKNGYVVLYEERLKFYVIDLLPQLKRLISENWITIAEFLVNHKPRRGIIHDIMDGRVYRSEVKDQFDGITNFVLTVSVVWHIDGAATIKSKDLNIWSIQCFVVEMPISHRYRFRSILLAGLWFGKQKPNMELFQRNFVNEVKELVRNGFTVELENGSILNCTFRIQNQSADLPAKASSLRMKQFNGLFGCGYCLHPGEPDPNNHLVRCYPYQLQKPPLRDSKSAKDYAKLATPNNSVFGFKGTSPIYSILPIPDKITLDYLHQVLEGEFLRRIKSWFLSPSLNALKFLKNEQKCFDDCIHSVKLPHDFKRKLRGLDLIKKWKASEKEIIFHHVGLVALKDMLLDDYFYHHALLITGIKLRCDDVIKDNDIQIAEVMLDSYSQLIPKLYSDNDNTYNVHAITHLPFQVLNHGSIVLNSAFVFEAFITVLKRLFHGTRGMITQMLTNIARAQNGRFETSRLASVSGSEKAKSFCNDVLSKNKPQYEGITEGITEGISFVCLKRSPPDAVKGLLTGIGIAVGNYSYATRMVKEGQMYHSEAYVRRQSSCSYLVILESRNKEVEFGAVNCFLCCEERVPFCLIQVYRNLNMNICIGLSRPSDVVVRDFVEANLLGMHFLAVEITDEYTLVNCIRIKA